MNYKFRTLLCIITMLITLPISTVAETTQWIIRTTSSKSTFPAGMHSKIVFQSSNRHTDTIITLPKDTEEETLQALKEDPNVAFIEPVYPVQLFSSTNDMWYKNQFYLSQTDLHLMIPIQSKQSVLVAILDTGIDAYHEDLIGKIHTNTKEVLNGIDDDNNGIIDDIYGADFTKKDTERGKTPPKDEHGHGTHIAGIIAAQQENTVGVAGINNNVSLLPIRFIDKNGVGNQVDAAKAIYYAVDMGADIINCSWGFYKMNTLLKEAVDYALSQGVIVIAAVGNKGLSVKEYPAAIPGVWAIGSSTLSKTKSYFSSYGNHVDFLMYGNQIFSTTLGNQYSFKTGTSQSAAIMSGIVSKIKGIHPDYSRSDIYELIKKHSSNSATYSEKEGYGVMDVHALQLALEAGEKSPSETTTSISQDIAQTRLAITDLMNYPNPIRTTTTFGFESTHSGAAATITIWDLQGRRLDTLTQDTVQGYNRIEWDPQNVPNGTYLYTVDIRSGLDRVYSKKRLSILKTR